MTHKAIQKTAILGMAGVWAGLPNLSSFWRSCMGDTGNFLGATHGQDRCRAGRLLEKTIGQAALDAGILMDDTVSDDTWLLILSSESVGEKSKIDAGFDFAKTLFANTNDFAGAMALVPALSALKNGDARFVVVAALGPGSAGECAVLVLGTDCAGASVRAPLAIVHSLERMETGSLGAALAHMPAKGIGHLVYLARQDGRPHGEKSQTGVDGHGRPVIGVPAVILPAPDGTGGAMALLSALIRSVLSLAGKLIPPSPCLALPPFLAADLPVYPNSEIRPWIQDTRVSARRVVFLSGEPDGHTAMVVLEEAPSWGFPEKTKARTPAFPLSRESNLVVVSADSRMTLAARVERILKFVQAGDHGLEQIAAFMASQFNPDMPLRLAMVCTSSGELAHQLEICEISSRRHRLIFQGIPPSILPTRPPIGPGPLPVCFPAWDFPVYSAPMPNT